MDLFTELILRNFIAHFVGLNTRYLILKLFGLKKSRAYLAGEEKMDSTNAISQNVLNAIVGIIVVSLLSILLAWLIYR